MKVVILLALVALCYGEYPAAVPEIVSPSDSYGPPPEAPIDSYGPPPAAPSDSYGAPVKVPIDSYAPPAVKVAPVKIEPLPVTEIKAAPAPEPIITETVVAAPAPSASFSFLSDLAAPSTLLAETNVKTAPAVHQEVVNVPLAEEFQLNIPGLVPPITSLPLPPIVPPIQVLPPSAFPPAQAPVPVPVPIQPVPVQPVPVQPVPIQPVPVQSVPIQPVPVQAFPVPVNPLTLPAKPALAPTRITAQVQNIPVQRVQTTFVPNHSLQQYLLSSSAAFNYAPYYFPNSFFANQKVVPQIEAVPQALPQILNLPSEPVTTLVETPAVKTPAVRIPATSYGTPAFQKKK